jgi:hypothetical protein
MTAPSEPAHTQYAAAAVRVEPHALPAVRAAFDQALLTLHPHVSRMLHTASLASSWLGDESSQQARLDYNQQIMQAADGPYAALVAYHGRLQDVRDQLARAEAAYRRAEGDNAELWGRA